METTQVVETPYRDTVTQAQLAWREHQLAVDEAAAASLERAERRVYRQRAAESLERLSWAATAIAACSAVAAGALAGLLLGRL